MTRRLLIGGLVLVLASCAAPSTDDPQTLQEAQAVSSSTPLLVQPGSAQQLLAVTSDNYVLYQEGTEVFASALVPGAQRQPVASVPAENLAFVYASGKVAFVWTNPDRRKPGFGVSPLWVWSAESGASFASDASPIGTFSTAASPDGRSILYPTRGSADGTSGDLELASADLSWRTTLAAGIPMGFPFGYCRPWASFVGRGGSARPVALYCRPGESTATLSSWRGSTKTDLLSGVATPPFFTADESGTALFTTLASPSTAVMVPEDGAPIVVDQNVTRTGFITQDGVVYVGIVGTQRALKRFDPATGERTTLVENVRGLLTTLAGSDLITRPWGSPDGKKLTYVTQASSGGVDQNWVDVRGEHPAVVIDAAPRNWSGVPSFTADSKQFLFARPTDAANGLGALFAQDGSASRQYSDEKAWNYLPATGSKVSYLDNFDLGTFTGDLRVVDLSRETLAPRRIDTGVDANFLASPDGRLVIYTRNVPGVTAGLYVARAEP
jgi:hypothetical protein